MLQQDLILEVVTKLIHDKNNASIQEDLPTVICILLKPFIKKNKTLNKQTELIISNMIRSYGICGRCQNGRLKNSSDLFCKRCKSVLKEKAKDLIG